MFGKLLAFATFEVKRCRFSRLIHHPRVARWIHPRGFEPVVTRCLVDTDWDGPVWDVGSNVGNIAYEVAQRHKVFAFEPNLNLLYYLGYKLKDCPNATVVPCALTLDGKAMQCSIEPNFSLAQQRTDDCHAVRGRGAQEIRPDRRHQAGHRGR